MTSIVTRPIRIVILGASGTGKTTLARALGERLQVPHFDSDDYVNLPTDPPYTHPRSPEERCRLVEQDLVPLRSWVLGGGVVAWTPAPRLDPTLLVFLALPMDLRIERLLIRERARFGDRLLPGGDMEGEHREFMAWTRGYDDGTAEGPNNRPNHEARLRDARCDVLRLEGPMSTDDMIARVLARLQASAPSG
jgi:adenylate kinase family enzyme